MRVILHLTEEQLDHGSILAVRAASIAIKRNKFSNMHGRKFDFVAFENGAEFSVEKNKSSYTVRGG
jgi:hypothetical protein